MTYRGHIKNGVAVPEAGVRLPEGAAVVIEVAEGPESAAAQSDRRPTLSERFAHLIGSCPDLPADMARNHDHYLHGRERK